MIRLPAVLSALALITVPTAAMALPRTTEAFQQQISICRGAANLILDGASDQEEEQFLISQLRANGWNEPGDLEDLTLMCVFFKQGYLFALDTMEG
ncbi:hypothetical protein GCM10009127_25190 [Alteraurantiacibacter aestuarii]|uniref:hypothetical protein n=1 Tax=Alteraurantiacibacter aestuarii TaxID=650004 RepID=UPI0031DBDF65